MRWLFLLTVLLTAVVTLVAGAQYPISDPTKLYPQSGAPRRAFPPVTDETIKNPSPSDWIAWRGTSRSLGHSPLTQITRDNVSTLRLAWSIVMEPGNQEAAPIVHEGVMYLPHPGSVVQALDAATGDILWEHRPPLLPNGRPRSGGKDLALYGDKLFLARGDGHLVALEKRTGTVVWDVQSADGGGYGAGPVVARGKVITGMSSCARFVEQKCFIAAYDANSGKELWRTYTIPRKPGEQGYDSWGDLALQYRAGAAVQTTGSYDPDLNLVYWSTGGARPWTSAGRGTTGAALFSNTVLALDADTGKMAWYRQVMPGENWHLEEVWESILVDIGDRKSLFKVGKGGFLWEMDRRTGQMVKATDLGYQNVLDLDPKTGAVKYKSHQIPRFVDGPPEGDTRMMEPIDQCPNSSGHRHWQAVAYSPDTQAFYIPHLTVCAIQTYSDPVTKAPGANVSGGIAFIRSYLHPKSEGNLSALTAVKATGETLWVRRQRAPFTTGTLTTAGGLVFAGDYNRYISAYDAQTGKVLWNSRAPTSPQGQPMSYSAKGRQYVAIPVGTGQLQLNSSQPHLLTPELWTPGEGNSLLVFALP